MLPNLKSKAVAAIAALGITATLAAPAHAFGQRERDFLKGVAAAVVVDKLLEQGREQKRQRQYYAAPSRNTYYAPPTRRYYTAPQRYTQPVRYQPTYQPTYQPSVYSTPAARAFNAYSSYERRVIQSRLADWGYYTGGIDGAFGPRTYSAISNYAAAKGGSRQLRTTDGAFAVYSQLLR